MNRSIYSHWFLAIVLCSALSAGCQQMGTSASSITPNGDLPAPVARTWPSQKDDVINQRARGYGLMRAPEAEQYLNTLYGKIKKTAGVRDWQGSVYLLGSASLDAYATAGGNIYISPTWLTTAGSEDEVVALLSHEFGHIYLHYHELEDAKLGADETAKWTAIGLAIAQKTAQSQGWTGSDTLLAGYSVTRDLAVAAFSRSQESAADSFGLAVSTKLGYSYEYGMKAFLEHILAWEEINDARRAEEEKKLAESLDGLLTLGQRKLQWGWAYITAQHPDTLKRLDAMAVAADSLPPSVSTRKPIKKPLEQVINQPRTNQIIKNFNLATKALQDLQSSDSLKLAKQSATGPTGKFAYNLMALNNAMSATQKSGQNFKGLATNGSVLDSNLASEPDRAWIAYKTRVNQLADNGQSVAATNLMNQGFSYFQSAKDAWPDAIEYYGNHVSWEKAKELSAECSKRFPSVAKSCQLAAQTPTEKAEADRIAKQKADSIVNKIFK